MKTWANISTFVTTLPLFCYHHPSAQNAAGKECQLQEETIPHLWGWGKEGQRQEKRCALKRWLSPFQLPSQITSQKTHPCTFIFLLSFRPAFHAYKTRKKQSIARLFLLETSSSFTSANLCFTLLKICSTNKEYRNSLLHCQNWRISEIWGLDRWLGGKLTLDRPQCLEVSAKFSQLF